MSINSKKKVQKLITFPFEMMALINDYRFKHHFSSVCETIRFLVNRGLIAEGEVSPQCITEEEKDEKVQPARQLHTAAEVTLPANPQSRLAIKKIIDFLVRHGSTHFQSIDLGPNRRRILNKNIAPRSGYKEVQKDPWDHQCYATYYFLPRAWKELLKDFNIEQVNRDCADTGLIMRPKSGQGLQIRKDIPGVDKKRVYAVRANHAHVIYNALHQAKNVA